MKELPKMYRNKINKEIKNNEKMFCTMYNTLETPSKKEEIKETENVRTNTKNNFTVEQKIINIFNSPTYIYKIDVVIVTDKDTKTKRIVGKTKTNLITMDNEYIPINTIRDIYISR
jgi:hypothetical protein